MTIVMEVTSKVGSWKSNFRGWKNLRASNVPWQTLEGSQSCYVGTNNEVSRTRPSSSREWGLTLLASLAAIAACRWMVDREILMSPWVSELNFWFVRERDWHFERRRLMI